MMNMASSTTKDIAGGMGGTEEMLIRLESSTHVSALTKMLEEQFLNESMVDVALVTEEGKFINAHKFILSAGSPYFKNIIETAGKLQFSQNSSIPMIICLSSIKYKHLYPLIKYVYTGSVDIPQNDLKVLVKTAFQLKISGLYEEAEDKSGGTSFEERLPMEEFLDDGESNDLSIEKFIKEEQAGGLGYDLVDMDGLEDVESNEIDHDSIAYSNNTAGSFHEGLVQAGSLSLPRRSDAGKVITEDSSGSPSSYPLPTLTKGHSSSSTSNNVSGTNFIRRKKQDASFPYHCQACGSGYKCAKSLWRHRKYNCPATESVNKVTFVCKLCTKGFCRADNLKRHTIIAHQQH